MELYNRLAQTEAVGGLFHSHLLIGLPGILWRLISFPWPRSVAVHERDLRDIFADRTSVISAPSR